MFSHSRWACVALLGVLGIGEAALSLGRDVIGDVAATFGSMLDTLAMSMVGGVTSTASLGSDAAHRLHS